MGRLDFLNNSRVYFDTSPVIYSVEEHDVYCEPLLDIWLSHNNGKLEIVTSELTLLETLVLPYRKKDPDLEFLYLDLLESSDVELVPISIDILKEAAQIRAVSGLKTPDSIHAATALSSKCDYLLTNDPSFRRVKGISVIVIDEAIQQ